jgi:predicted GNAT family acetyltransferase
MLSVHDDPERSRFELLADGAVVGHADYHLADTTLTIPHVEVDRAHRGKGFAGELMSAVLDVARERGFTVRPVCSYAADYMRQRPDTHDLYVD